MRAVCDIIPQKTETCRSRLPEEGNMIDCLGKVSTPTSDLAKIKLHFNRSISDIKSRYMCMDINNFLPEKSDE